MKKTRIFLALGLAVVLMLSCLSLYACNDDNGTDTQADSAAADATNPVEGTDAAGADEGTKADADATDAADEGTKADDDATDAADATDADDATQADAGERWEDEEEIAVYDGSDSSTHMPLMIAERTRATGFKVHIPEDEWINGFAFCCPSYSDDYGSLTLKLYRIEDGDLAAALKGEPVYFEVFEDFTDNQWLEVILDEDLAKSCTNGDYACVVMEGKDEIGQGVGLWMDKVLPDDILEDYAKYEIKPISNGRIAENSKTMADGKIYIGYYWD